MAKPSAVGRMLARTAAAEWAGSRAPFTASSSTPTLHSPPRSGAASQHARPGCRRRPRGRAPAAEVRVEGVILLLHHHQVADAGAAPPTKLRGASARTGGWWQGSLGATGGRQHHRHHRHRWAGATRPRPVRHAAGESKSRASTATACADQAERLGVADGRATRGASETRRPGRVREPRTVRWKGTGVGTRSGGGWSAAAGRGKRPSTRRADLRRARGTRDSADVHEDRRATGSGLVDPAKARSTEREKLPPPVAENADAVAVPARSGDSLTRLRRFQGFSVRP